MRLNHVVALGVLLGCVDDNLVVPERDASPEGCEDCPDAAMGGRPDADRADARAGGRDGAAIDRDARAPRQDASAEDPDGAVVEPDASLTECINGVVEERPCGLNGNGVQSRSCEDGRWSEPGECEDPDECIDGQMQSEECGEQANGTRARACVGGRWGQFGPCDDPDRACEGAEEEELPCGINGRGLQSHTCVDGRWGPFEDCVDPDNCVDGSMARGACGLNERGAQIRECVEGRFGEWSECVDPDVCVDDATEEEACGLEGNGVRSRRCLGGQWGGFGECRDPDACEEGAEETVPCGRDGSGERTRTCVDGRFGPWSACDAEDPCPDPGNAECGPELEEVCNGLDDDHDGQVDEGLLEGGGRIDDGFDEAVEAAIDRGLGWVRARVPENGNFTNEGNARHNFLAVLALLERREHGHRGQQLGYAGLEADDRALVRRLVRRMIEAEPSLNRPDHNPNVYTTGGAVMALSAYLRTGGQDDFEGMEVTARQALEWGVASLHRTQGNLPPNNVGGWNYNVPNNSGDTSTTHFAINGLSAAGFVLGREAAAPPIPVTSFLDAAQAPDGGFGYHPGQASSSSMSTSSLWMHYLGGTDPGDERVSRGLDWLAENYRHDSMVGGFTPTSTYYYLWAQQKALPALLAPGDERFGRRDPAALGHHPARAGSFYDTAITLMSWQAEDGRIGTGPGGSPGGWSEQSSHLFALLTLERSFGGVPLQIREIGGRPQCNDEVDNDGDGATDAEDPQCVLACVRLEREVPACDNERDDDGDGLVDLRDPGCAGRDDDDEANPACSNGVDDDADGRTDWWEDPGCAGPRDGEETDEEAVPACGNGADDDGDGAADLDDADCYFAAQGAEDGRFACGREVEVVPPDRDRIRLDLGGESADSGQCGGPRGAERVLALLVDRPGPVRLSTDHPDTAVDTVLYVRGACADPGSEIACNDDASPDNPLSELRFRAEPGVYFVFVDSTIGRGEVVLTIYR